VESHGGYLCRFEDVDVAWLQRVAREAIESDGHLADECGLLITLLPNAQVMRFAFDGAFTYGRSGARWYLAHHAFARRLSMERRLAVHAYVFDPDDIEQVVSYGNGRKVGGESLKYEDVEIPDDDDEVSFERLKNKWPMGHLARVLGVDREALLRMPRQTTALVDLTREAIAQPLWHLFPQALASVGQHRAYATANVTVR
jgi:hypothetical protein